eukprot:scaffold12244_cov216-Isochrysis_galbana.AAC.5
MELRRPPGPEAAAAPTEIGTTEYRVQIGRQSARVRRSSRSSAPSCADGWDRMGPPAPAIHSLTHRKWQAGHAVVWQWATPSTAAAPPPHPHSK